MKFKIYYSIMAIIIIICSCKEENLTDEDWYKYAFSGSYRNLSYTSTLVGEFDTGIYYGDQIPEDIIGLEYGRIEIDFIYDGGGQMYFAPLFYYGSINKNNNDDTIEEPQFHLAIEIGHYKVIPTRVEYLFYTICTYNFPQYCRDTYIPIIQGEKYTVVIDKKPEGIILQMKKDDHILNIFPHAYFPDSTQMFFKDVTSYTNAHKGDSLQQVMMVGRGFAGIEGGIHHFNGEISALKVYKYDLGDEDYNYEIYYTRNQLIEDQHINYIIQDKQAGDDKYIIVSYEFQPYKYETAKLIPFGEKQTGEKAKYRNNKQVNYIIRKEDIGYYEIHLQTTDEEGNILRSTEQPFEIWVYPKEWGFKFY